MGSLRLGLLQALVLAFPQAAGNGTEMLRWPKILGFALLSGGMLVAGFSAGGLATTSATLDILSNEGRAGSRCR